jgi:hypothetical protein
MSSHNDCNIIVNPKKRKIYLRADDGTVRTDMGKDIHNHYNDIINLQPQKYIKQIKEFLKCYE